MNIWIWVYKGAWVGLALLLIITAICMFVPKLRMEQDLQANRNALADDKARIQAQCDDLTDKMDRFNSDPLYVEHVARDAGMVKSNEFLVKFTNTLPRAGGSATP